MVLSARARKLVKWIGYPLFAVFGFVVFFYATFPYDRLREVIEDHLSASGELQVAIGEVGPSPLLGVTLSDVKVELVPPPQPPAIGGDAAADTQRVRPQRILIDRLTVSTGLLAVLAGNVDVSFSLRGLGGELEGSYAASKAGWTAEVEAREIRMQDVPQVAAAVGLPVEGKLSAKVLLATPQNLWSNASGSVELSCQGCAVGDGKAKLKIPNNPMLAQGITMPRVRLGQLGGQVTVDKGVATLRNVSARSPDVELKLDGTVNLRQPVAFSTVNGYLQFKISSELKRRSATFELLESGLSDARRSDGFFGMRISGSVKSPRTFPSKIEPGGGGVPGSRGLRGPGGAPAPGAFGS